MKGVIMYFKNIHLQTNKTEFLPQQFFDLRFWYKCDFADF